MKISALLDVDLVALEASDRITLMLDLTAPDSPNQQTRPGQAVQVVLDVSGSMQGKPLSEAKGAILRLVDRLAPQDFFGLVVFDDTATVVVPIRSMADHQKQAMRQAISEIRNGGSTDISAGYLMGLREVKQVTAPGGSSLLLISDGMANAGEKNPKFFAEIATDSALKKITTSTIGLGSEYDETILEALAQGGGGAHRFANSVDEAVAAISEEVDNLLDKTAINTVLRITPTSAMTNAPAMEFLQRMPHWRDGDDYVVQLGDFYSGENRRFVIEIILPEIASLGLCQVAELTLAYMDLASMKELTVTMPIHVNVVPGDVAAGRIPDPVVKAESLILRTQIVKTEAISDLKSGNRSAAAQKLRDSAEELRNHASNLPQDDPRTNESRAILDSEVEDLEKLARSAEVEDWKFTKNSLAASFSESTRSRKQRSRWQNQDNDSAQDSDDQSTGGK